MYVMASTDLEEFNDYVKKTFPSFYDDGWTKEQSDKVYLGQGIEMIQMISTSYDISYKKYMEPILECLKR